MTEQATIVELNPEKKQQPTKRKDTQDYRLDEGELQWLRELKLINEKHVVFFALLIDFGRLDVSLTSSDVQNFCTRWGVEFSDFWGAIAQLQKKEIVKNKATPSVQLELISDV